MPSFYAHERFGRAVAPQLSEQLRQTIADYAPCFQIGLQGPDVLFYYRPWRLGNRVAAYGVRLHKESARPFLMQAQQVIAREGRESRAYAYLLGFLCHYVLDSECHPYVNATMRKTGAGHLMIEAEFDKYLLRKDGKEPLSWPVADHIPTDQETKETLALFYPDITAHEAEAALSDFQKIKRLLTAPGAAKQMLIDLILRFSFHYHEYSGLMLRRRDDPRCKESNQELAALFERCVPLAAERIAAFDACLCLGRAPGLEFSKNFEGEKPQKEQTDSKKFHGTAAPHPQSRVHGADSVRL